MTMITQNKRASLKVRKDDLYETPAVAVKALLEVEEIPHVVWEPACGPGSIVTTLREAGYVVMATDLVDYGCPRSYARRDFLMEQRALAECIVTNPPFKLAQQFVEKGLELCPKVIMLLRLAFLESERRSPILDTGTLARVHVFRKRLPMMHRHNWEGKKADSQMTFAWFVWDRDHNGPTELRRLSWRA